jgi:drug/metabolite transporter (DMT)-like permease
VPLVLLLSLLTMPAFHAEPTGLTLAVLSGGIASALVYAAWYAALSGLTATQAAVLQLAVPLLAAAGGVALLAEPVSARLVISAFVILGGIGLVVGGREVGAQRSARA